jgi:hypothetical protein
MKTTVDLPDDLLEKAKTMAASEQTTLKSLIEEGLRWVLSRKRKKAERFLLRDASVSGDGVGEGLTEGDWDQVRELIYRGRGS